MHVGQRRLIDSSLEIWLAWKIHETLENDGFTAEANTADRRIDGWSFALSVAYALAKYPLSRNSLYESWRIIVISYTNARLNQIPGSSVRGFLFLFQSGE